MCHLIVISVITLLILILSILYVREGYDDVYTDEQRYMKLDPAYDGEHNRLVLPPNPPSPHWFEPAYNTRAPESYSPSQSGMDIPAPALKYNGHAALADSYGVGYTDERGWY